MSLPLQDHTESSEAVPATTNMWEPAPRKRKRVKTGKLAGSAIIELPGHFESPRLIVMLLGCLTCRARKVKCDETHPLCNNCSNLNVQASIKKLVSQINKNNGDVIKSRPRFLPKNSSGIIELEVQRPISIETHTNHRDLGRIMIRSNGVTIAAGLVTELKTKKS